MNTETNTQKLPKWFDGKHYSNGEMVTNPFSKDTYYLNGTELSMYDFIMGCNSIFEEDDIFNPTNPKLIRDFNRARDWFRKNNSKAYMILID